jgi:hypothetical protein
MHKTAPYALFLAALTLPVNIAQAQDAAIVGVSDVIDESVLGPSAPGGVRPDSAPVPAADAERWQDRVALTLSLDWTTAYYSRGYRQEDRGFILQPAAVLNVAALKTESATLSLNFSTWHSIHDKRTAARADAGEFYRRWYEADYLVGASLAMGNWTVGATYGWLDSPSDAFLQVEELTFAVSYNDAELMGAWSLKPAVAVIAETGRGTSDGKDRGVYGQLTLTPGFDVQITDKTTLRVDVPFNVGFSLHEYYQDAGGGDEWLGFASIGPKLTLPLPLPDGCGTWSLYGNATYLWLNDHVSTFNGNHSDEWVFGLGISVAF